MAKANKVRRIGVSGSMLRSCTITAVRVLADAGMSPEAYYDPIFRLSGYQRVDLHSGRGLR